MKIRTKQLLTFIVLCMMSISVVRAADLHVNEDGLGGAYTTISAAIAAASDGDRIFIKPRSLDAWFVENLTIDKSITLSSDVPGTKYRLKGSITIVPKSGMKVVIRELKGDGATDINGNNNFAITPTQRVDIKIFDVEVDEVNMPTNYDLSLVKCTADKVFFCAGKVIANTIKEQITVNDENTSALPISTDSLFIVANDLTTTTSNGIFLNSIEYYYMIANNRIKAASRGIDATAFRATGANKYHQIINNYIEVSNWNSASYNAIHLSNSSTNVEVRILNNEFKGSGGGIGVRGGNSTKYVSYNKIYGFSSVASSGITSSNNYTSSSDPTINQGNPDRLYYDLDLTRNDIGTDGGSYAWSNYWNATNARVYHVNIPRLIFTGTKINVKADAYDGN